MPPTPRGTLSWPDGKRFAFTVFDDTDLQTLENAPPVYSLLGQLGFRTTKSVWPVAGAARPRVGGATCEEPGYAAWVQSLQADGFEIGLHNATYHTSPREVTERAFRRFQELFGHPPRSLANHTGCDESIYWGTHRLTGAHAALYRLLTRSRGRDVFAGHVEGSPLFWGDLCREQVHYVRNFVFGSINTLRACPWMPYHDPARPYVNAWFASSEGPVATSFCAMISEANQDRLEAEGGACIMYTHFGCGFYEDGRLHPEFRRLMERLARKQGWFVPVSTLLDHLAAAGGGQPHTLRPGERALLERRWLLHKLRTRGTT
jgi:hypothetical protein